MSTDITGRKSVSDTVGLEGCNVNVSDEYLSDSDSEKDQLGLTLLQAQSPKQLSNFIRLVF